VDRAAKKELVTALNGVLRDTSVVVVAHYSGLNVAQMQTLRKQMKLAGAQVKVAKNRLVKIAAEGTEAAAIVPLLKGPTLIAYSGDPIAAPKVAADFAKGHDKFVILGGAMGQTALDANGVKALPRCLRSTNCAQKSSASFRRRQQRSRSWSMHPRPKWRGWCRPTPAKARLNESPENSDRPRTHKPIRMSHG
jgi:large subunit ribosomal protein L10